MSQAAGMGDINLRLLGSPRGERKGAPALDILPNGVLTRLKPSRSDDPLQNTFTDSLETKPATAGLVFGVLYVAVLSKSNHLSEASAPGGARKDPE